MFKFVGCLVPTFLQPPVFWARLQILVRLSFYWKWRERAGADHNCTLFETYQSYLCSSLLAIWWQLFCNLQFSELVSNFRAAGLLLETEKKGCSSLRLWFIWNTSKLLLLTFIGVWWELFSNLLWFVWHIRKRQKHLAFFLCNGGKGLEQLTMIVDLKVESSLYQSLAVFGGNYSFVGHYYWWILCSSLSRAKAILLLLL